MYDIRYGELDISLFVNPKPPPSIPDRFEAKKKYFDKLLKDVAENGLRNPLICSGRPDGTVLVEVGYSRIWAAQEAGIKKVKCFVNDSAKYFSNLELIETLEQAREKFVDQPALIKIYRYGITSSEPLVEGKSWWD